MFSSRVRTEGAHQRDCGERTGNKSPVASSEQLQLGHKPHIEESNLTLHFQIPVVSHVSLGVPRHKDVSY